MTTGFSPLGPGSPTIRILAVGLEPPMVYGEPEYLRYTLPPAVTFARSSSELDTWVRDPASAGVHTSTEPREALI